MGSCAHDKNHTAFTNMGSFLQGKEEVRHKSSCFMVTG
jgi:hypothetical protein